MSLSRGLVDVLEASYGFSPAGEPCALEESFNFNVVVRHGDSRLVVRVYRPSMTVERLEAVQRVRRFLIDGGLPFAPLRPTLAGNGWCRHGDRLVEVEDYVPSETFMETFEHLRLAMPLLAQVHDRLRLAPPDEAAATAPVANHVDVARVVDTVAAGVAALRGEHLTAVESGHLATAETLARQLRQAEEPYEGLLPRQLVHGDFWDDNVKFTGSRVSLITDLDFMGERPRVDDLALTLFYAGERLGRDDLSGDRLHRLRELVDAYSGGLLGGLSVTERRALPYAIARTPLCFVSDWVRDPGVARDVLANRGPAWSWALAAINAPAWTSAFTSRS